MGKVILGMTMSLDGFVNDRQGSVEALYYDFADLRDTEPLREAIQNTGAVVMGRRAFAMAEDPDWYAGNYEFQTPIFVLTHEPPEKRPAEAPPLTFTFVTSGPEAAIQQARAAAGDRDVMIIGGASTVRQCIETGLVDELDIDVMPVVLCEGQRLFDDVCVQPIKLERMRVLALPSGRTNLRFRILK